MKLLNKVPMERQINREGRLVLPKNYRDYLDIKDNDYVSCYLTDKGILIKKEKEFGLFGINGK